MRACGLGTSANSRDSLKTRTNWLRSIKREIRHDIGPLWWLRIQDLLDEPLLHCYDLGLENITPQPEQWFRALKLTPLVKLKVVIIGEEPYHQPGYANGLAFSRQAAWDETSSLTNIFKELRSDLGIETPSHGDLSNWAKRGVLLLNSSLTCEVGKPGSGKTHKWQPVIDRIIESVNNYHSNGSTVWWLMGKEVQHNYESKIRGHIIRTAHPSPNSAFRGFFFSKPFSTINSLLETPLYWTLSNR